LQHEPQHAGRQVWSQGECAIWALRALPDGISFRPYRRTHSLTTCQAFGFVADAQLGNCVYGDSPAYTACVRRPAALPDGRRLRGVRRRRRAA